MNRKIRIGRTTCGNRCPAILARTACSMIARLIEASLLKRTRSGHGFWRARLCWRWASSRCGDKFAPEVCMQAKARLLGHPIHQMLIVFPLGVLGMSLFFDIAYLITKRLDFAMTAFWMIFGGVIAGLLAAIFGLIDWLGIPSGTRAKRIGLWHGGGNVVVVALFIASWILRRPDPGLPKITAIVLSAIAVGIALITGWLGGELVDRLGVGVDEGANLNAPSSLSGQK